MGAGAVATLVDAVGALQAREPQTSWRAIGALMDDEWRGVDELLVATFYTTVRKEWPKGPSVAHVDGFVKFMWETYDEIVAVPEKVCQLLIRSVFDGTYRILDYVPRDTVYTLQLLIVAAITAHRQVTDAGSPRLTTFVTNVARDVDQYRRVSR